MANIKSAKKRAKTNIKRHTKNVIRRSEIKTVARKFSDALEAHDFVAAQELLKETESKMARAKGKKVIKANTAARKVSRLAQKLNKAQKAMSK